MRSLESALAHLEKRRAVLGGVVISGGEPTAHPALPALIAALHEQGFPVKLDTNGMNPRVLAALFRDARARPDYIALDLKVAPERYGELAPGKTGQSDAGKRLTESARLIAGTDIQREYRSLALPDGAFGAADIAALAPLAAGGPWVFRRFVPGNCLDPAWNARGAAAELPELFAAAARKLGANGIAQSYTSPQRAGH